MMTVPSQFAGGERWKDANWKAACTPIEDLGVLPFEIGHGAALVALPPRGKYFTGTLPAITGSGTSAAFHDGKVLIKRGGLNFAAYNSELWIVEPVSHMKAWRAETRLKRERMSLKKVDFLSLQFDSNGHEAFTVWVDGLEFGG